MPSTSPISNAITDSKRIPLDECERTDKLTCRFVNLLSGNGFATSKRHLPSKIKCPVWKEQEQSDPKLVCANHCVRPNEIVMMDLIFFPVARKKWTFIASNVKKS
jgi:hypothetical protein